MDIFLLFDRNNIQNYPSQKGFKIIFTVKNIQLKAFDAI